MELYSTTATTQGITRLRNSAHFPFLATFFVRDYPVSDSKTWSNKSANASVLVFAGEDQVNNSDPSGMCINFFNIACVGSGSVTSTVSFRFDPGAGANIVVNIGRGASFGLSDKIANWISPGASCTVPQNGIDQFIGGAATLVTGGELLGGLFAGGEGGSVDQLLASGQLDLADAGGQLTRAGRAYAKAGEVFGPTSRGPAVINEVGHNVLEDILANPDTTVESVQTGRFLGGPRFISPDGVGVVFGPDGMLQYFGRM